MVKISVEEFRTLAERACIHAGGSEAMAKALVQATISAEFAGRKEVGTAHFLDYLDGLQLGRIAGHAEPDIQSPLPAFITVDAKQGIAQLGFDRAFADLVQRAQSFGIAIFTQKGSYTAGEIGYYVRRLAQMGLISIAFANAQAFMATNVGGEPVYSTNPLAFGAPLPDGLNPLIIDQASSVTAFVNIVRAASEGRDIPDNWALDALGQSTTDPAKAMLGALLPFGGYKGANVALMVEILAAGLTGAHWSLDAGDFRTGTKSPNIGLTIIAISPAVCSGFTQRLAEQLARLKTKGVSIPGAKACITFQENDSFEIDADILARIRLFTPK